MNSGNVIKRDRKVDVIFCIDGTGSMAPCIDMVKANAKRFHQDLMTKMTVDHNSNIDELNVKVIVFRDYGADAEPMQISEWFDLTAGDVGLYEKFLDGIVADGGGDDPENGFEALFKAMSADWRSIGSYDRQVIVLFTDQEGKEVGTGVTKLDGTVEEMVDEAGLENAWRGTAPAFIPQNDYKLRPRAKRMIIYAPAGTRYQSFSEKADLVQFVPTVLDGGVDIDFSDVIRMIAASVAK